MTLSDHPADGSSSPPLKSSRKLRKAEQNARLEQAEAEWLAFPDLPGKRLTMTETSERTYTVIDVESDTVLATCRDRRGLPPVFPASIASQGRTFQWRPNRFWFVSRVRHLDLIDAATKTALLHRVGSHIEGKAETRVTLTAHDSLQFPVRGTPEKALMTAVTSSGERLIEYALIPLNAAVAQTASAGPKSS